MSVLVEYIHLYYSGTVDFMTFYTLIFMLTYIAIVFYFIFLAYLTSITSHFLLSHDVMNNKLS